MYAFISVATSSSLAATLTDETGSGAVVFQDSPLLITPGVEDASGSFVYTFTPSVLGADVDVILPAFAGSDTIVFEDASQTLTNKSMSGADNTFSDIPLSALSGLAPGMETFLGDPSSANLAATMTDETGTGLLVFNTSPTIVTPQITTSATITNNGIGTVSSDGLLLQNTTPATAGIPRQISPRIHFVSSVWNPALLMSQQVEWYEESRSSPASNPVSAVLIWTVRVAGGAPVDVFSLSSNGGAILTTGAFTVFVNSIGAVSTDAIVIRNITASTAVAPVQWSGRERFSGTAWNTTTLANQSLDWIVENQTVSGTSTTSNLTFSAQKTGLGYARKVQFLDTGGIFVANNTVVPGTPVGGGVLYVSAGALRYKGSAGTDTLLAAA